MTKRKTVFITGAGRGLGRAIVDSFYQAGFRVFATDTDLALFSDRDENERLRLLKMDVTDEQEVRITAEKLSLEIEHLDVLVSNAGIFDFYPVSEAGTEKFRRILEVNTLALSTLSKYFAPVLTGGRLIVISSESYKVPSPFQPYAVSKQMLEALYRAVKAELAIRDIRSILVRPGAMKTKILDDTLNFMNIPTESAYTTEFRKFLQSVPWYVGRIVTPQKVAGVVLKAAIAGRPKAVYHVNHNPLVSILSGLPRQWQEKIVLRTLKR